MLVALMDFCEQKPSVNDAVPVDVAITEPIAAISNISPAMAWESEVLLSGGEGASLTVHAEICLFFALVRLSPNDHVVCKRRAHWTSYVRSLPDDLSAAVGRTPTQLSSTWQVAAAGRCCG